MSALGFEKYQEFLVGFDEFKSLPDQRMLFFEFFNNQNEPNLRFSKSEMKEWSSIKLSGVFAKKIKKFKNEKKFHEAQKLFELIGGKSFKFSLDAKFGFEQFILNKLLKDQKNRFVEKNFDSISIIPARDNNIKIFAYWQFLEENNFAIDEHIKNAVQNIKEGSFKNIYLVYPKSSSFYKHIQIKVKELEVSSCSEYNIKLIPYSLRSILR